MKKILSTFPAPEECFAPFRNDLEIDVPDHALTYDELLSVVADYDALFVLGMPIDKQILDAGAAGRLRVVANDGVGYDNVDVAYASKKGVAVINTPTQVTEATAEHTAVLIFAAMRIIAQYDREIRDHVWNSPIFPDRALEINGSTLGILGFGRIGKRVCKKAQGMGMNVIYYDAFRAPEEVEKEFGVTYKSFEEVLRESDVVTLHVPYTPENRHMINADTLAMMKKDAYLVNCSRGPVVDEHALAEALRNGVIRGASLDVFENEPHPIEELLTLENVTLTPHAASGTWKTRCNMAREAMAGTVAYFNGEMPYNVVNKKDL